MKQIIIKTSKTVSYIFHLLSVARINYDNSYSKAYEDTINRDDLRYLYDKKQLLKFANGNAGLLVNSFIFTPAYIDFKRFEDLKKYFINLKNAIELNKAEILYTNYKPYFKELTKWHGYDLYQFVEYEINNIHKTCKEQSLKLINIFIDNYSGFENVWKIEQDKISSKIDILSKKVEELNLIAKWEELTQLDFKTNKYDIILCSSIKYGPQANSLGYDKNVFYYDNDIEWMVHFISHEIGTHIFIDIAKSLINFNENNNNNYEPSLVYGAYESLAKFYNKQIFNDGYDYPVYDNDEQLQMIYNELVRTNPYLTPREMIVNALKKYNK